MTYPLEPSEAVGMSARRLERIRPAMQSYVDSGVYAGVSTLIARRGKVVHAEQVGWRDKEVRSPVSADTIFRLYSMTKPIVCTGLMTLLEEGRFSLFDPVAKYIPAFAAVKVLQADGRLADPARPVTLSDLMTHTSGLTYHFLEDSPVGKMYARSKFLDASTPLEAAIDDLAQFPLAFQPGSRFHYSVGIDVVARVIEVISGRPLGEFLHERLFEPLGMVDTDFGVAPEKRGRLAAMYGRVDVLDPTQTSSAALLAWTQGVNERIDVSKTYPVDSPKVFVRGGHGPVRDGSGLFPLRPDAGQRRAARRSAHPRAQDARAHARNSSWPRAPADRDRRSAVGGLWLRSRLTRGGRRRANGRPRLERRIRLVGGGEDPLLGRSERGARRALHDQSMLSFDLPELDLRALAYQAITD